MEKEFLKKFKEFINGDGFIRKEIFINASKRKVVAFAVSCSSCIGKHGSVFVERSDEILKGEKDNFDEKIVLYEWVGNDFCKIENVKNQNWFII